jgi:glycosyltransferase involved in cell wall biosynthesis
VPNTFDFDGDPWQLDGYNQDFRAQIGLRKNDILVLQATRIVARKGIEMAIDFVRALGSPERRARLRERGLYDGRSFGGDSRIVLVLVGYSEDRTERYLNLLKRKAQRERVDTLFVGNLVGGRRGTLDGQRVYSLWDTYVHADFITYPSLWEGWGNQLLEALKARVPLMLFEYPVYLADIKDKGLRVVSLGRAIAGRDELGLARIDEAAVDAAADEAVELLTDRDLREDTVAHNLQVARHHYSLGALREYLRPLMAR